MSASLVDALEPMFQPRSVAIVGASATPFKHGNVAIKYLAAGGYEGEIYPINPNAGEIEGLKAYACVTDVPGQIDCAFFVIPAALTNEAIRQCAQKGVRAIIIGSSGFAEQGTENGRAIQREMIEIANKNGIRILGPNTNGIWNASAKFSLGYNTSHGDTMLPGAVSIAAHSGALMNSIAPALRGLGAALCKYVPVGNEANTDLNDIFEYLIEDVDTRVIGLIIEAIGDGERFRALARKARAAGKPVVALKLGRSKAGAAAAQAHASRLAGRARAYEAFLRGCGVMLADGIESLAGACALMSNGFPQMAAGDGGLVGISTSGGGAELIADHAEMSGIPLAGDGAGGWPASVPAYFAKVEGSGVIRNPVDAGNLGGVANIAQLLECVEAEGCNGPVLLFAHQLPQEARDLRVAQILLDRRMRTGSPVVCVSPGGLREAVARFYAENGVPVFRDTKTCFDVLRCWHDARDDALADALANALADAPAGAADVTLDEGMAAAVAENLRASEEGDLLTEIDSAAILRGAGVPIVESYTAQNSAAAVGHAERIGYPVVLKGIAPGIAHKNDAGLVATGITDAEGVERAFARLEHTMIASGMAQAERRIVVQKMLPSRIELIAGVTHEPQLGHFLVAGLGGLMAEALDEVILIPVPASRSDIENRINGSRLRPVLHRLDKTGGVQRQVAGALQSLQSLVLACPGEIHSIDVNPLLIGEDHVTAVDALIELRRSKREGKN